MAEDTMDNKKDECVTNKIMSSYSLGTLAAISKLKYSGHIMHSSDSMKK